MPSLNACNPTPEERARDGLLGVPPLISGEAIEVMARRMWFAAYREIYLRERVVYPEYVDLGGEGG